VRLEAPVPEAILAAIRAPFEAARGIAVEIPLAEPLSVYLDLTGEALRERLFLVQGPEREDHCLRPDFTVGIARNHLERSAVASEQTLGRYIYEGPAFRVAPAGSARSEQFLQIGLEAFESGDVADADAEVVLLAWRAATAGGRADLSLALGDIALFRAFLAAIGANDDAAARLTLALAHPARLERELTGEAAPASSPLAGLLVGLDEAKAIAVLEDIWSLSRIEPVGGRGAADIVHRLTARATLAAAPRLSSEARELVRLYLTIEDQPAAAFEAIRRLARGKGLDEALTAWSRRLAAMAEIPAARMRFAAGFHRPFGYYDGALFEVRSAALGEDQPVAAGGRYDNLPARLGRPLKTGAVGCMVRPARAWKECDA
jgi:ATP phosphoribosyltransferase regulatory subunit